MNQLEYQTLQSQHLALVDKVFAADYYLDIFRSLYEEWRSREMSPEEICSFWNKFWECLPDSSYIHRGPFYEICDMAEGSFLIGEDE